MGELSLTRLEKGEVAVALLWDYNALGYRDQFTQNNANANFEVCIPSDGAIQSGYCTVINAYTKHPYAAALTREYILSDEGQINLAKGYAKPVRSDVVLPDDVKAKLLPNDQYSNARMVTDYTAWGETTENIATLWQEEVIAYIK
jgi:putative spermidine/putrescine transport system substrate-binding protein